MRRCPLTPRGVILQNLPVTPISNYASRFIIYDGKELFYDYEQNSVANSSYRVKCVDVIYKRRSESDDSINHTKTSKIVHFWLFL